MHVVDYKNVNSFCLKHFFQKVSNKLIIALSPTFWDTLCVSPMPNGPTLKRKRFKHGRQLPMPTVSLSKENGIYFKNLSHAKHNNAI